MVYVYTDKTTRDVIRKIADEQDMTMSQVVNESIIQYLEFLDRNNRVSRVRLVDLDDFADRFEELDRLLREAGLE